MVGTFGTGARKDDRLAFLVPADEKRAVIALAARHGLTTSEFVRAAIGALANIDDDDRRMVIAQVLVR